MLGHPLPFFLSLSEKSSPKVAGKFPVLFEAPMVKAGAAGRGFYQASETGFRDSRRRLSIMKSSPAERSEGIWISAKPSRRSSWPCFPACKRRYQLSLHTTNNSSFFNTLPLITGPPLHHASLTLGRASYYVYARMAV